MPTRHAYSPGDSLFQNGAEIIQSRLNELGCLHSFFFVDFRVNNLPDICPGHLLPLINGRNTVIICDDTLIPLSLFYVKHHKNVIAIYSMYTCVEVIIQSLMQWTPGEQILRIRPGCFEVLTRKEADILGNYGSRLAGESSENNSGNIKTIYTHEKNVARKLGRKRFVDIFN
ncbi:hypothetical protein HB016_002576 [Salmonella enterica subsp. enterica]|nr:hypothetical protein [Salmonella enterica]EBQ9480103.1 hypothetical protein [Salmonella enterica subsp. enterica serovar Kokomlemle]ECS5198547.1 hypothetical protein [Salmonella enterica subsp. enterica serovar Poano]EBJ7122039.1 hypothetical protein [Salmonella enterica]ECX4750940.1 hypothetical protein [Salmonella enterica]